MAAYHAPPSLGFSSQEHWSGVPFPSSMRESEVAQLYPTLCDPMDCSLPGSSIHGIFQAKVLEWGAIAFSSYILYNWVWFGLCILTYCLTSRSYTRTSSESISHVQLCNPMDCSPPGSSVHGILEWVAIPFSRGSSNLEIEPWSPALQADSLPSEPPRKPY